MGWSLGDSIVLQVEVVGGQARPHRGYGLESAACLCVQ